MNASVPIEANGIIPISQSDVAGIPPIALSIPDFEGQAILRIFANSSQSQIGCYSAVVTNGATFSHPSAVGTVLGLFTVVAVLASFATAIYGNHIPTTRTHYAHSLSILVVFSVFHSIFFTGALSMNWPSVLVAFWSNYAWSAGMIYRKPMQNSINQLIGSNRGNTSMVGAAGSGSYASDLGGGYAISNIYKRSYFNLFSRDMDRLEDTLKVLKSRALERTLAKRALANSTTGYTWYGSPIKPGLPLPGNFSAFPGTLAEVNIPASNALITGFLWFLILTVVVAGSVAGFKAVLEGLSRFRLVRQDRLTYFRAHWIGFTGLAVLRTMLIGLFMMLFLTLFQFTYKGSAGVTAIGVIIFLIFFVGMFGLAGYACYHRLRFGHFEVTKDRIHVEKCTALGYIPWYTLNMESRRAEKVNPGASVGSVPCWRIHYVDDDSQRMEVHQDEDYVRKFGWLSARFRRTRWWFFIVWMVYEFLRACFYGGAAGEPMTQVFGLLVVEIVALVIIVLMRPFEGTRLNVLMVYLLGFSKVATVALSAAFDSRFNLQRITTTVIGIVIIVIQGILTIILMVAIVVGTVSSYMSLTRNREDFSPRGWAPFRQKYFTHLEKAANDLPPPPPPIPEEPKEPYFNVGSVRRLPKIEDEGVVVPQPAGPHDTVPGVADKQVRRASRADSMQSQTSVGNVPFGARLHGASWSSRDFSNIQEASNQSSQYMTRSSQPASLRDAIRMAEPQPAHVRTPVQRARVMEGRKSRHGKERESAIIGREQEPPYG
jgi:hypothetical protein